MFRPSPTICNSLSQASSLLGRVSQCSNAVSGLSFVARRHFYCGVVEPAITYAALICCDAAKLHVGKASLRSTQCKFCIHAIQGFRTVPTLTAIALLRVRPLDLKVLLLSSFLRPPDPLPFTPESAPPPIRFPFPPLLPDLSFSLLPPSTPDFDYYTDGSKSRSGIGAGIARAECFAFRTALTDLCSLPPSLSAAISSDCLSLLSALSSPHSSHPLIAQCLPSRNLTLHWVKGHSGNLGNCLADTLAKGATVAPSLLPQYALASKTTHNKFISHHFWSLWEDEFISARPSFFLKLGLTPSSLSSSHKFLFPSTAIATSLLTGHTFIAAFPHRKTPPPFDPTCPHCNQAPETIDHIFFDCPNLDSLRTTFFHNCLSDAHGDT
ncbi:hypothetical protein LAZ67_X004399 [Cordylochernes scorpioides]|uniref:RNase H type-1 domain-containing protein n=1 Tax=Cordylochernes scorpioides TaxID=51811 RepID=A0ABY6LUY1_9ARAC|nr:hypothetical protein LAZ67_X004399 [Cordylochernes scorpioides]